MFNNIMEVAFQNVSTVKSGIELLEKFHTLAKRTNIKSQVEGKMANNVLQMFNKEINEVVKKEYEQMRPRDGSTSGRRLGPMQPRWAGAALWAKGLIFRLEMQKAEIDKL